jgi:hypothetical protein
MINYPKRYAMTSVAALTMMILLFPAFGTTAFAFHGSSPPDSVVSFAPVINGIKSITTSLNENSNPVGYGILRDSSVQLCDVQDKPAHVTVRIQPDLSVSPSSPLIFNNCDQIQAVTFKAIDGRALDRPIGVTVLDAQGNFYSLDTRNAQVLLRIAPKVISTTPTAGATDVLLNSPLTAKFSENVNVPSGTFTVRDQKSGAIVPGTVIGSGDTRTFTPSSSLQPSTTYTATLAGTITDTSSNPPNPLFRGAYSWSFTTQRPSDITAPTVESTSPQDGATNVAIDIGAITATFSEPVKGVDQNSFKVNDGDDNIGGSVSLSSDGLVATFSPTSALQYSRTYTATLATTITDLANNALTATDWSFTTGAAPDTIAPTIKVPSDITQEATSPQGSEVTYEVSAEDNVDGPIDDVSCNPPSGSTFPLGETTTVKCTATDAAGNTGTGSFKVTIQDTTPPAISVPDSITAEATGPGGAAVSFADEVSAEDLVDGHVDVSCDYISGDTFPLGQTTTVTCTAEDSRGNSAAESFTITVQDTTAPDVEITDAIDRRNRAVSDGSTTPTPYIRISFAATDAVGIENTECSLDGGGFTSCTSPVVYDRLSRGDHEVTVRSTDAAGNSGEDQFAWTVGPQGPPAAASRGQQQEPAAVEEVEGEEGEEEE